MCATLHYNTRILRLIDINVALVKIKATFNVYTHKQILLVSVLESTEAVRAVSLSARAYAVT